MRVFVDFNIKPTDYSKDSLLEFINMALHLGYKALVIEVNSSEEAEVIKSLSGKRVKLYTRFTISAHSPNELKNILRKIRWSDLIIAECYNQETARTATKLKNISTIMIPLEKLSLINERQINAMRMKERPLEIKFMDIFYSQRLHTIIGLIVKNVIPASSKIPIIVSSGAREPSEMRSPRDMIALFSVLGVSQDRALDMISKNPYSLLRGLS